MLMTIDFSSALFYVYFSNCKGNTLLVSSFLTDI